MNFDTSKLCILTGNANPKLAEEVAQYIGVELCHAFVGHFNNGETQVMISDSIRGKDVFIIQPTSQPVNDNLMELLVMADACRRASAQSINAVVPYYAYSRQDRKTRGREPISAKLVANLMTTAGIDRVITVDLHAGQIQGFFDVPVDNVFGSPVLLDDILKKTDLVNPIVVSPDIGGVVRARAVAKLLNDTEMAIIDKRRPKPNVAEAMNLIGDVDGKTAIIIDDMVDTAGTLTAGIKMLKDKGAKAVYASCSHGILSGPAIDRLKAAELAGFVCTNTIDQTENQKLYPEMTVLSMAPLLAGLIHAVEENSSLSEVLAHAFDD